MSHKQDAQSSICNRLPLRENFDFFFQFSFTSLSKLFQSDMSRNNLERDVKLNLKNHLSAKPQSLRALLKQSIITHVVPTSSH